MQGWHSAMSWLRGAWARTRQLAAVLAIVRFSLLVPAALAIALVLADQMIDILRALGEDRRRAAIVWLLLTSAFAGLVVWYTARTMLRFRFAANPASDPAVHPRLKRLLPRLLGICVPGMLAVRVGLLAAESDAPKGPWIFTAALLIVTAAVAFYVFARRSIAARTGLHILADPEQKERRNLRRWRELPPTTLAVLAVMIALNLLFLVLFMWQGFYRAGVPAELGAPAILLLGLGLTAASGSAIVYMANHYSVPVLTLLAAWAALCSIDNDNHMVRVTSTSRSHGVLMREAMPPLAALPDSPLGPMTVSGYSREWWQELEQASPGDGRIPVFIVSAEGGGLRAAYWTAVVLAELEDETHGNPIPFSRHVFAVSGVSGGSVGAVLFDAMVAARLARQRQAVGSASATPTRRKEMERVLAKDFLSDTVGNALFPDLLQRFLPAPLLSDRAIALEHSFERAWLLEHPHDDLQLSEAFHDLWRASPHSVPLLFLNSTVVETGQRAINYPLATHSTGADPPFADTFPIGSFIGTAMPLSTAALLSARFTYVSPAGLIDTRRTTAPRWIRLVDGGYFDNSGAVTAQELAGVLLAAADSRLRLIVLHLPNDPETPSAQLNAQQRSFSRLEFLSEVFAPPQTLLNTRGARGTQAVSYLRSQPGIELLSIRPCRVHVTAPLGWVLSGEVRHEMSGQLESCHNVGAHCAAERLQWVAGLVNGNAAAPLPSDFNRPPLCD
jgi:hypothetical protein